MARSLLITFHRISSTVWKRLPFKAGLSSALSVLVGALLNKFGLFLNTPRICFNLFHYQFLLFRLLFSAAAPYIDKDVLLANLSVEAVRTVFLFHSKMLCHVLSMKHELRYNMQDLFCDSRHKVFNDVMLIRCIVFAAGVDVCELYTGLFKTIVGVIHNTLQMQPHMISFYGVTSRIRFMLLLFPQVSRN